MAKTGGFVVVNQANRVEYYWFHYYWPKDIITLQPATKEHGILHSNTTEICVY